MKKKIQNLARVALFLVLSRGTLWAAPADSSVVEGRLRNLEMQRDNLEREVELHKQELALRVDERSAQNTVIFWVATGIALIGTASILTSFWVGIQKAKQSILQRAEGIVEEQVESKLPKVADEKIQEAVTTEIAPLNRLLARERENERFRTEMEVLSLGETLEDAVQGVERLLKLGYCRVKPYVPTEKKLPPSTCYFFNLFRRAPEQGWENLTDSKLQSWIDADEQHQSLFFYFVSERKVPIDTKRTHPFIAFANRSFTVDTNMVDAIRDYHFHVKKVEIK